MSDQEYPGNWRIAADYDPKDHMMNLKGRDYLNVQNRLLWFIRDQRELIVKGLATTTHVIRTELVEQDRQAGYAHFKTTVRDVLGNEATMYGSETAKDFPDYAEKASTKSLGRALLALGYGTGMAPEMDESEERPVDSPIERKPASAAFVAKPPKLAAPVQQQQQQTISDDEPATKSQQERMRKYREVLTGDSDKSIAMTDNRLRYHEADARIADYIAQYQRKHQLQPAGTRPN